MFQEGDKRQLRETSVHPSSSERYVHTFRDLSNFSGTINVTYRYLAGTPLNRKSKFSVCLRRNLHWVFPWAWGSYSKLQLWTWADNTVKDKTQNLWCGDLKHSHKMQLLHRDLFTSKLNSKHDSSQVFHDLGTKHFDFLTYNETKAFIWGLSHKMFTRTINSFITSDEFL